MTVISAVIQIGLALPMVVYFHRVGLSGLSANALVVPVMGLAVPVGFVAVFTGWAWVAQRGRMAAVAVAGDRRLACQHGTATGGFPRRPCGWRSHSRRRCIAAAVARGKLVARGGRRVPWQPR